MALAGLLRAREFFGIGLLVLFLLLRSVFLGTLENPEPRYTLECYPVVIVLASAVFPPAPPAGIFQNVKTCYVSLHLLIQLGPLRH